MKRQMKKLISMILAMAMVVTSINFTPKMLVQRMMVVDGLQFQI